MLSIGQLSETDLPQYRNEAEILSMRKFIIDLASKHFG